MNLNPIVLSIPVFFVLIGIEVVWDRYRRGAVYRLSDALTNISCGVTEQVSGVLGKAITVAFYYGVYEHFRLFTIPPGLWSLLLLFVLVDFCYYWAHRWSHEVNLFWAGHVVHHQSEYYNLSVALRQGMFQKVFTAAVYAPLALLGFHPYWFLLLIAYNTLYQFWIHTQYIGTLGWLEYVFNTPSHHRVHHGRNPEYIDKNHAGSLIIWDKLFGTFEPERAPVVYGTTAPLNSWNPVYAQVAHVGSIAQDLKAARGLREVMRVLFGKPGWHPAGVTVPSHSPIGVIGVIGVEGAATGSDGLAPLRSPIDRVQVGVATNLYVLAHYLLLLGVTTYFLFRYEQTDNGLRGALVVWIFATSATLGMLLERHSSARLWETIRLVASGVGAAISLYYI